MLLPQPAVLDHAGIVMIAIGAVIYGLGAKELRDAGVPLSESSDQPAPRRLVDTGVFGFTRNPMFLGQISVVLVCVATSFFSCRSLPC